jgi:NADH dehydrogenase/putative oxidoreductase
VPGLAPAAKQAGAHAAKLIRARVEGRTDPRPFVYRHLGSLATIGRKAAVVDFGRLSLRGALAWWFWGAVHIGFLIDLRSRLSVMFHWVWAYLTYRSGARLIIGSQAGAMPVGQYVMEFSSRANHRDCAGKGFVASGQVGK